MRLTERGKNPCIYVEGVDSPRADVSNRSKPPCEAVLGQHTLLGAFAVLFQGGEGSALSGF